MKQLAVLDSAMLQRAVIEFMYRREAMKGRHIGGIFLIADEKSPEGMKFRANVVHFDTEKAAREYSEKPVHAASDMGQVVSQPVIEVAAPQPANEESAQ